MKLKNGNFIGVFDSGIGGISVLNSCISLMPQENYVFFADSGNFPYGKKSKEELTNIGLNILSMFNEYNAKEVIIACNTMTTSNMDLFNETYKNMQIIGTYPDFTNIFTPGTIIKEKSISFDKSNGLVIRKNKIKLLIIATTATCKSEFLNELINEYKKYIDIYVEPTDFIVKAVENDKLESYDYRIELKDFFKEYKDTDYLFLGCTHFSHATKEIRDILGDTVKILSGGDIAATNAYNYLKDNDMISTNDRPYIRIIDESLDETRINLYRKLIKSDKEIIFDKNFVI